MSIVIYFLLFNSEIPFKYCLNILREDWMKILPNSYSSMGLIRDASFLFSEPDHSLATLSAYSFSNIIAKFILDHLLFVSYVYFGIIV